MTRWFVKTSLLYLLLAGLLGILVALRPLVRLPPSSAALMPVYLHLFIVGWLTQLIFGVMHWMFPKDSKEKPRGDERLVWSVYGLLNGGLLLRAVAEPLAAASPAGIWGLILVISAALQWLAALGFVINNWRRVKGR